MNGQHLSWKGWLPSSLSSSPLSSFLILLSAHEVPASRDLLGSNQDELSLAKVMQVQEQRNQTWKQQISEMQGGKGCSRSWGHSPGNQEDCGVLREFNGRKCCTSPGEGCWLYLSWASEGAVLGFPSWGRVSRNHTEASVLWHPSPHAVVIASFASIGMVTAPTVSNNN